MRKTIGLQNELHASKETIPHNNNISEKHFEVLFIYRKAIYVSSDAPCL
jgi:hypothetical protein